MGEVLWSLQTLFKIKKNYKPLREHVNNLIPNSVSFKASFYLLQSKTFLRTLNNPFATFQEFLKIILLFYK